MNENEHNFEELRRLLALKRHEIPPPGYFEDFSSMVIARIRSGDTARELPWLLRFLQMFESRPAYPVAFASGLCTLLLFGIISVERQPEIVSVFPAMNNSGSYPFAMAQASIDPNRTLGAVIADTNPPVNLSGNSSLFQPNSLLQPNGYSQPGN